MPEYNPARGRRVIGMREKEFQRFRDVKTQLWERLRESSYGDVKVSDTATLRFLMDKFEEYLELKGEKK